MLDGHGSPIISRTYVRYVHMLAVLLADATFGIGRFTELVQKVENEMLHATRVRALYPGFWS